jgi:hypothetical protein
MRATIFCQLMERKITREGCQQLQMTNEPSECFGCASSCRRCARCRQAPLVCPEIDLCAGCLALALQAEAESAADPDQRCSDCQARPRYYQRYQLCLHCAVKQFCPDVLKKKESTVTTATLFEQAKALVLREKSAARPLLRAAFHLKWREAEELQQRLQEAGIIAVSGKSVKVLVQESTSLVPVAANGHGNNGHLTLSATEVDEIWQRRLTVLGRLIGPKRVRKVLSETIDDLQALQKAMT